MKSHLLLPRLVSGRVHTLLLVSSFVVAACIGMEVRETGVFAIGFRGFWGDVCHNRLSGDTELFGVPVSALRCLPLVLSCTMEGKLKSSAKSLVKSHETSEILVFKNSVLK